MISLLEALIDLVRLPYEAGRRIDEASLVGPSEWDRKSRRFWKWFAWILTSILIGVPLAVWCWWRMLE